MKRLRKEMGGALAYLRDTCTALGAAYALDGAVLLQRRLADTRAGAWSRAWSRTATFAYEASNAHGTHVLLRSVEGHDVGFAEDNGAGWCVKTEHGWSDPLDILEAKRALIREARAQGYYVLPVGR